MSRIAAIVPSVGASPCLAEALGALRSELASLPGEHEIFWVHQGNSAPPALAGAGEQLVSLSSPAGFARAVNLGIAAASRGADRILVMNDDLILASGWLATLDHWLTERPETAAVQGMNLRLSDPGTIDGCGLAWNRDWQAVQLLEGKPARPAEPPFEIFGVSATAALYRVDPLRTVSAPGSDPFAESMGSYYEDVELAVRLRQAGFSSDCVPAARCHHAGQATSRRAPRDRWRAIYRNRRWVLRRLLGDRFGSELPRIAARDRRDLVRRLITFDFAAAGGILDGLRAARQSPLDQPLPDCSRALAAAERLAVGSRV